MTRFAKFLAAASASVVLLAAATTVAHADAIDTFNETTHNGECCFKVVLDQKSTTDIGVTVSLVGAGELWAETGGPHRGFTFNVDKTVGVSNINAPWSATDIHVTSTSDQFGTFTDWIDNSWESGTSGHISHDLTFDITVSSGTIGFSDFTKSTGDGGGFYFSADFLGDNNTGEGAISDGGTPTGGSTPEPSSLILLGTGIVGAAGLMRRRAASALTR